MSTRTVPESVQLLNPWTDAAPPDRLMTWPDLRAWAAVNVHADNRLAWLRSARRYYLRSDGRALGRMVIGS
jgi:hypothetical protein